MRRTLKTTLFLVSLVLAFVAPLSVSAQFDNGDILLSDFFDGVFELDPRTGDQQFVFGSDLFVRGLAANEDFIYASDFGEGIIRYDIANGTSTEIAGLEFADDIVLDQNNDLIVVNGLTSLLRLDAETGDTSLISTGVFDDAVVSRDGTIYAAKRGEGIGFFDGADFISVSDDSVNIFFEEITLGQNGVMYASNIDTDVLYQVDLNSGIVSELTTEEFVFIQDLETDLDGSILAAANFNGVEGIYRVNPITGEITTIVDDNDIGEPWAPLDLAVIRSRSIPEPCCTTLIGLLALAFTYRRSRIQS